MIKPAGGQHPASTVKPGQSLRLPRLRSVRGYPLILNLLKDGYPIAVNWNAGLPSRGRDPLKRLQRQTKGYTKSLTMRRDSLALV